MQYTYYLLQLIQELTIIKDRSWMEEHLLQECLDAIRWRRAEQKENK